MRTQTVAYEVDGTRFEGLAVWDDEDTGARPGVLVAPTVMGRTAFEEGKAEALARLGYVGLALDIYGVGVRPTEMDEARRHMDSLNADRRLIAARMAAALAALRGLDGVDAARTAAIGFCFGGKCVLDLARSGSDLLGVATFHGLFDPPGISVADRITAKVLALHGWDDPLAKPEDVIALAQELTDKGAIWELDAYGHSEHGFTARHRPQMYRPLADARSWTRLTGFLAELF
ncbi:dienelactone hydrolase family protein [Sphingomonas sp.]|uniref:dienelactone hydrolase family protein n=1 Tax=Sphingomonas sp. TaxID=28214 RepID=UPI003B009000